MGGGTAATDPAAPVQIHRVSARSVGSHRLVAVVGEEQMAVVGTDYRVFDPCRRELAERAREVVDDCVHHLSSLKREASLTGVIDLL